MTVRFTRAELNQLLVAALEVQSLPVLLHDDDSILFANAAARALLGAATPADIEGVCLDRFLVPELVNVAEERRGVLLRNHVVFADLPIKMLTLDGRTIHLRVDAQPIAFNDVTVGMVTVTR